ncbi:MAG: phosphoribosylamine--glycine ligase [Candidatus Eremiobacteraeota bacterium]|nr:phosphoribosylamine--glycine ligase [Candidatus Eremiobacteraeota bacterium]
MRVLVVGNGAREDALSWRIAQSPSCDAIFAAPGNAGTASRGENWDVSATDGKAIVQRSRDERIDLVMLGPETAIAAGVGDRLREAGIPVVGPNRSAGRLESSKIFAKRFMQRHDIPTARAQIVHSLEACLKVLSEWQGPVVVKADGLAAGKGVVVTPSPRAAHAVLEQWYSSGVPGGGNDVLLEEALVGREISLFAVCDGRAVAPFGTACDYKRAGDGDTGPNTGGMGAYSPPLGFPDELEDAVRERVLAPLLRGLLAEGEEYIGILYCGLMWCEDGPQVIEFNVRFGDPEAQVLMPRITGDLAALLRTIADGAMDLSLASFSPRSCVGVVLATAEYPQRSTPLHGLSPDVSLPDGCHAFWGGSTVRDGAVAASGGRVLTVTALGDDAAQARERAYDSVSQLASRFGAAALTYRSDIAKPAMSQ